MRRWLSLAAFAFVGCAADTGMAMYHLQQGDLLLFKQEYQNAIPFFDRAIQADSKLPEAHLHRGIAKRGNGDYEGANYDITMAIELNNDFGRAWYEFARTKIQQLGNDPVKLAAAFDPDKDPYKLNRDLDTAVHLAERGGDDTAFLMRAAVRIMQKRDALAKEDIDRYLRRRRKIANDVANAAEAWTKERPVLNFELIDALVRVRPKPG